MFKNLMIGLILALCCQSRLMAHCQMPCGIYHDEMVFDQIDQFVETTVKAISVMEDNPFKTVQDRNAFVRWVMQKDKGADEVAHIITTYFLQQKIKPGEEDTTKRVLSAHLMLFYLVQIKQTVDLKVLNDFYQEWEKFKLMFHIDGYKCKVSQTKLKKWVEKRDQQIKGQTQENSTTSSEDKNSQSHDHDHDHDHDDHDHDHDHDHHHDH
jgi:nickel superoxide dismutase